MDQNETKEIKLTLVEAEVLRIDAKPGETLIFKFKGDEFMEDNSVNEFGRQLRQLFPKNKVVAVALPNNHDIELTVLQNEAKVEESNCSAPASYCNDCGCGKKERIEGEKK